jgi:predicted deacylase
MPGSPQFRTTRLELTSSEPIYVHNIAVKAGRPHVAIISGIHGDEWYGPAALLNLLRRLRHTQVLGQITIIPAANPDALFVHSRTNPKLRGDLNRSFLNEASLRSSAIERQAAALWDTIRDADLILDVHSCGVDDCVDHIRALNSMDRELAASMPLKFVLLYRHWPKGLLIDRAFRAGKKTFAIEYGTSSVLNLSKAANLARSLMNFLITAGAIDGHQKTFPSPRCVTEFAEAYSNYSGIFEQIMRPGVRVRKNDVVGRIKRFADVSHVNIRSERDGTLLLVRKKGPVGRGSPICTIG